MKPFVRLRYFPFVKSVFPVALSCLFFPTSSLLFSPPLFRSLLFPFNLFFLSSLWFPLLYFSPSFVKFSYSFSLTLVLFILSLQGIMIGGGVTKILSTSTDSREGPCPEDVRWGLESDSEKFHEKRLCKSKLSKKELPIMNFTFSSDRSL